MHFTNYNYLNLGLPKEKIKMKIVNPNDIKTEIKSIPQSIEILSAAAADIYVEFNTDHDDPDPSVVNAACELELEILKIISTMVPSASSKKLIEIANNIAEIVDGPSNLRKYFCSEDMQINALSFLLLCFSFNMEEVSTDPEEEKSDAVV